MIYITHYTTHDKQPTGHSMPSGFTDLAAARAGMPTAPFKTEARFLIYDNGDGTRLCFSDFPFKLEEKNDE